MKAFLTGLIGMCLSCTANAALITLDPDDFAAGTDLSGVSPYVALTNGSHEAVHSGLFSCGSFAAATGSMVFGLSGAASCHGWASQVNGPFPTGVGGHGFVASFADAVSNISLQALNHGYAGAFAVEYTAYDENFQVIMHGIVDATLGEWITIELNASNIRYFDVGGIDGIGALSLDQLSFEIPVPGTLTLMLLGLAGCLLGHRRMTGSGYTSA